MIFFRIFIVLFIIFPTYSFSEVVKKSIYNKKSLTGAHIIDSKIMVNNFGMPGLLQLPSAGNFPEGEMVFYQRINQTLSRTGFSFQLSPRIGLNFSYHGVGKGGSEFFGRINHDRSFSLQFGVLEEARYRPAISVGIKDFIGTGWYSSEYIVGTKTIGRLGLTAGLGFGRLAGRNQMTNPLSTIHNSFKSRTRSGIGLGGTLHYDNWFKGPASPFAGLTYAYNDKVNLAFEYSPDLMLREASFLELKSPYNLGLSYSWSERVSLNAQYLHGSTITLGATIQINPKRPLSGNGQEKGPIPMRRRAIDGGNWASTNIGAIKSTLATEKFVLKGMNVETDHIRLDVQNTQFRSTSQALGRIISTLQRFSGDEIDYAIVVLSDTGFPFASYRIDLQKIGSHQSGVESFADFEEVVEPDTVQALLTADTAHTAYTRKKFNVAWYPYLEKRLFDPIKPIRGEIGLAVEVGYQLSDKVVISSAIKKSLVTDLDKVIRLEPSALPRVVTDIPLYDQGGQPGHVHHLSLTHQTKISKNMFSRVGLGYLTPKFAGVQGELLYKLPKSNFAFGIDINAVKMRDYNMLFGLRDYKTISGHFSIYYDSGGPFDLEINAGRYLAKDWGVTTTISKRFENGWTVGAYATLTDVPFDKFGEGSFDKAFFVTMPVDWLTGSPTRRKTKTIIQPIARDGGATLGSARGTYEMIRGSQRSEILREYGRIWK